MTLASSAVNPKEAASTAIVPEGPEPIVTTGARVSTVTVRAAEAAERFPAASLAVAV
jgi:predicted aconitase with swiveling domain